MTTEQRFDNGVLADKEPKLIRSIGKGAVGSYDCGCMKLFGTIMLCDEPDCEVKAVLRKAGKLNERS